MITLIRSCKKLRLPAYSWERNIIVYLVPLLTLSLLLLLVQYRILIN